MILSVNLLSRINGDAPAHIPRAGRLDSSRVGLFNCQKPLLYKSIRTRSFDRYRYAEANHSQLLFSPPKGKGKSECLQNSLLETSLSKRPAKICRNCFPRSEPLNQRVWSKTV